jgi:hypothetical protein
MKFPLKFFLFAPVILISLALAACSGPVGSGSVGTGGGGGGTGGPFTIGGTVSGLAAGASMTLQNNGAESLIVSTNGTFTFKTAIVATKPYLVTVAQPQPRHLRPVQWLVAVALRQPQSPPSL